MSGGHPPYLHIQNPRFPWSSRRKPDFPAKTERGGGCPSLSMRHPLHPLLSFLTDNPPTPHFSERVAPTPLRFAAGGPALRMDSRRSGCFRTHCRAGGVPTPHVPGGVPTPSPSHFLERGTPHPPVTGREGWGTPEVRCGWLDFFLGVTSENGFFLSRHIVIRQGSWLRSPPLSVSILKLRIIEI